MPDQSPLPPISNPGPGPDPSSGSGSGPGSGGAKDGYTTDAPKVRRVALAVLLCGPAACVVVALAGIVLLFVGQAFDRIVLGGDGEAFGPSSSPLVRGALVAGLAAAFNWIFFYFTIPAAWIGLGLSLGRFPRRDLLHAAPYLRWGAVIGAGLVTPPTLFAAAAFMRDEPNQAALLIGAGLGGAAIGAVAGIACAGLFLAIVRPSRQVQRIDAGVF